MISFVRGVLAEKHPTSVIIDVQGIGYEVFVTVPTVERLGDIGQTVSLLTHLHHREDAMQLYGFLTAAERMFFQQLIAAPGIGPKKALIILSAATMNDLKQYIVEENLTALASLPGIGKKTAQRLVVDLKEKLASQSTETWHEAGLPKTAGSIAEESLMALVSLGYPRNIAMKAVQTIVKQATEPLSVEEVIKQSLKEL